MSSSRKRGSECDIKQTAAEKKPKGFPSAGVSHGLYNQGSTCYLSSILQLLHMTPEFHDRLQRTTSSVDKELRHIFDKMKVGTCETRSITEWLEIKNVHREGDAGECLEMILNKVSPQVSEVFQGELMYETRCDKGCVINNENTPFWKLPLSLTDTHTPVVDVQRSFDQLFKEARFSGDNLVHCESCDKRREASSTCEMVHHPHILTLLLKRFEFSYTTRSYSKSSRRVSVPLVLQAQGRRYKLYGIVDHIGSLQGGHYTSTVLSSEDDTWYTFDDSRVEKNENFPLGTRNDFQSINAYLILYRVFEEGKSRRSERKSKSESQQPKSPVRKESKHGWEEEARSKPHHRAGGDFPLLSLNHSNVHSNTPQPEELRLTRRNKAALDQNDPSKCLRDTLRNPILIAVAVVTCMIIGVVIVVLVV